MREIREDYLQIKNATIKQFVDGYCFTSDAVFLANYIKTRKKDVVLDIGTGSGIIPLIVALKKDVSKIIGIEIQEEYAKLATQNVRDNNLQDKIEIVTADIKDFKIGYKVDCIVCNPPYFKVKQGFHCENDEKKIAKTEVKIELRQIVNISKKSLQSNGKLYVILKIDRMQELFSLLTENKFSVKSVLLLKPTKNKKPDSFIVEAILNGKTTMHIDILTVYDETGKLTNEAQKYYE